MSIVKSFSVRNTNDQPGDMFYIKHGTSNFTIIDCCLNDNTQEDIVNEIINNKEGKNIIRFISTHPDEDHICGLKFLDKKIDIRNFYCVENSATKEEESESFKHYCKLRDDEKKSYYVYKDCKRMWMNDYNKNDPNDYGCAGINFLWPIITNEDYINELEKASEGKAFNNISPIFTYSLEDGVEIMWMGDIERDFLEKVKDEIDWPEIDILFAPHHGRNSGKVPSDILNKLNPYIIVIGDAPSEDLNYYNGYNTITQNTVGDIVFNCTEGSVDVYTSKYYEYDFLEYRYNNESELGIYIGSFNTKSY